LDLLVTYVRPFIRLKKAFRCAQPIVPSDVLNPS
jgi:hypothetical protein